MRTGTGSSVCLYLETPSSHEKLMSMYEHMEQLEAVQKGVSSMSTEDNKADVRRAFEGDWIQKNAALLRSAERRWSLKRRVFLVLGLGALLATLFSVPIHAAGSH